MIKWVKGEVAINLNISKQKVNWFCTWDSLTLHLIQIDIKHLFLDRIQGCFDAGKEIRKNVFKFIPGSKTHPLSL